MNKKGIVALHTAVATASVFQVGSSRFGLLRYTLEVADRYDLSDKLEAQDYGSKTECHTAAMEYLELNAHAADALFAIEPWIDTPEMGQPDRAQTLRVLEHLYDEEEVNWYV